MKIKNLKSNSPVLAAFVLVSLLINFGWASGQTININEDTQELLDEIYSDKMLHKSSDTSTQGGKSHSMDPGRKVLEIDKKQGRVGINTVTPEFTLDLEEDGSIIAKGTWGEGAILQTTEPGSRLIWYPRKAAFRVGDVYGDQWDDANIGDNSIAMGFNVMASGPAATAIGIETNATGIGAVAFGSRTTASGTMSTAMGSRTTAVGRYSLATGYETSASGHLSTTFGYKTEASAWTAVAMGDGTTASGVASTASGVSTTASGMYSTAMGYGIEAQGDYSVAIALNNQAGTIISQPNTMAIMGGNVGIDDPAPAYKLSVNGDTRISGDLYVDGIIHGGEGPGPSNAVDDYITDYQYYQSGQYAKFKLTAKQDFVMVWEKVQDDMIYFRDDLSDLFAYRTNTDYGTWGPDGFLETTDELDNIPIGIHEKHFLAGNTYDAFITSWGCGYDGCSIDGFVTAGSMTSVNYIIIRAVVDGAPAEKTIYYSGDASDAVSRIAPTPIVFDLFSGLKELGITIKDGVTKIAKLLVDELRIRIKEGGNSVVGSAAFPAHAIELQVKNSLVEENSQIFITFKSDLDGRSWYLSEIVPGQGFTVKLNNSIPKELKFNYWIVLVEGEYEESNTGSEAEPAENPEDIQAGPPACETCGGEETVVDEEEEAVATEEEIIEEEPEVESEEPVSDEEVEEEQVEESEPAPESNIEE